MPIQVLWLPEFLKDSRPARVGLGVFLPPSVAKRGPEPWEYLAAWKDKVRNLVKKVERQEGADEVRRFLDSLGPEVAGQYIPGDEDQEELIDLIRAAPEVNLEAVLEYLRNPIPAHKLNLLARYPQDPGQDHLNLLQEQKEQKDLNLDEFLLSL